MLRVLHRTCHLKRRGGYDLVVCEGMINGNENPSQLLKHIASFVKPGGLLVITTVSAFGVLDQGLRRIYMPAISTKFNKWEDQVTCASNIFRNSLQNLPTTKPVEDWVQDAILHPLKKNYIFSTSDAINSLTDFKPIGSSPRFYSDYRWFKSLKHNLKNEQERFLSQYKLVEPILLDSNLEPPQLVKFLSNEADFEAWGEMVGDIWDLSCEICESKSYEKILLLQSKLSNFIDLTSGLSLTVTKGLEEFIEELPRIADGNLENRMPNFEKWWGRGVTYLALVRE
jgi:hypothetical protein